MKKDDELYRQEIYKVLRKKFDNDFINGKELNEIVLELESIYNQNQTTLAQDQKLLTEAQFISKTGHYILDITTGEWTSSESLNSIFEIDETFERSIESWLDLVHPGFKTEMQEYVFKHILTDHKQFDKKYKIKTPIGIEKWVHGRGNLTFDTNGNPIQMFGVIQDITEQKRNEELLNESNIRYSLAVNSAGLGVWEWDLTKNELTWDDRVYEIYDLKKEDFTAALDAWLKCLHPDDSDRLANEINLAIEDKKPYNTEFKIISGKGEVKYIKAYGTITRDVNGKALIMYGVNLDITDRKVAEELLIQSEKRYHNFFNYDLTGDYLSTPEGKILDFNDAFAEMVGYTDRDELLHSDPNLLYLHKKDRVDFLELLRKEKIITHHKIDVRRKDGEIIQCIENCVGLFDENDNLIKIQGYLFDISEIERATAALKESEKKFRLLFENMVEGFALHEIITDENNNPVDYVIIDANPAYERITGLKRSAIIGKPITEVLPGTKSEPANWIERYGKVALTGEYTSFEEYSIALGRWYLISAYSPQPKQFAVIIEDITEAKLAEEKIKESEEEKSKILSSTLSGLYIYNNQIRKYEYINPTHSNITGWSLKELNEMGEELFDLIHPEDFEKVVEHFKILLNNEEDLTQIIEYRFKTKESAWIWLISYDRPYERDKNGNVVKFIGSFIDNTKQKEIEFALRESESRFRLIFDNTKNIAVQGYQKDGTVHYWNKASEDLYGYTKEEAFGKSLYELIIPDNYITDVKAAVKQMFDSDKPILPEELQLKRKDGTLVPVYSNHTVVNVAGKQKELYCIDIDLTERKKAEAEAKLQAEIFEKAFKTSPDAYSITRTKDGVYIDVNDSFKRILGYNRDEMIGKSSIELNIWRYKKDRERLVAGLKEKGYVENLDAEYLTKSGDVIYGLMSARVVMFGDEEVILSITRDITDRKRAEQALIESEQRYLKLISNISDVIVIVNKKGEINYKSSNIEQYFGWKPEDLVGKCALSIVHPDDIERVKVELDSLLYNSGYQTSIEFRYRCKDGKYLPVELTALSLIDDPTIEGIVANYKDISERKKAQKAVVETQRLGAIGEMSSAIAHDFNNSLQSILGNLELSQYNIADDHPSKKYLDVIQTTTSDAATRVKQLQRFAGKSNKHDEFSTIDINEIVKDVILQSRPLWKNSPEKEGIKFNLKTDLGELPQTSGNVGELRSVLYNIIKNSVESMPKGGTVTIKSYFENEFINILIKDEGVGMDDETKSRIFQPFFTTKGFETGRGLGMSGAYSIIKEHDGNIYVKESSPNSGTTIAIELPSSKNIIKPISKTHSNDKPLSSANILWVDDDKSIREIAEEMLIVIGHSGKVVGSGSEALKELENNKFDLVVTDIGMPGMSGWDLADRIFEMFNGNMKVAVLTGWGDQISEEKRKQHNVKYVIGKPFRINELDLFVNRILQSE